MTSYKAHHSTLSVPKKLMSVRASSGLPGSSSGSSNALQMAFDNPDASSGHPGASSGLLDTASGLPDVQVALQMPHVALQTPQVAF